MCIGREVRGYVKKHYTPPRFQVNETKYIMKIKEEETFSRFVYGYYWNAPIAPLAQIQNARYIE